MYVIRNDSDGMYLMGTQSSALRVLTCIWGDSLQDAKLFSTVAEARYILLRIGGHDAVVRPVQVQRSDA